MAPYLLTSGRPDELSSAPALADRGRFQDRISDGRHLNRHGDLGPDHRLLRA